MSDDIIDRIDAQLAAGEPPGGYSHNDPTFPKCWHCNRHWHGLPITRKIVEMYNYHNYLIGYRADEDYSQILCQGSDFIGPMPSEQRERVPVTQVYATGLTATHLLEDT